MAQGAVESRHRALPAAAGVRLYFQHWIRLELRDRAVHAGAQSRDLVGVEANARCSETELGLEVARDFSEAVLDKLLCHGVELGTRAAEVISHRQVDELC